MTETQTSYKKNTIHKFRIPSREYFHRFASNLLSESDFNTEYPTGYESNKVASALRWTLNNEKKRKYEGRFVATT